jgi:hypothetical protein
MTTKPDWLSDLRAICARVAAQVIEVIHDCRPLNHDLRKALEDLIKNYDEYYDDFVGIVVPLSEFPTWDDEARNDLGGVYPWASLSHLISEAREIELRHGALPTPEELLHVARYVVSEAQEGTSEFFFAAFLYRLAGSDGREAWGVVYQRGGPYVLDYEFDGPFLTREQAQAAIAARGFTAPEQVTIDDVSVMLPDPEDL